MAEQDSLFHYRGKLGNTVGVKRNGKYHIRNRSKKKPNQTPATQASANRFGQASSMAAFIRKAFYSLAPIKTDNTHINRLTKRLIPSAGKDLQVLIGYRFNLSKAITSPTTTLAIRIDIENQTIISSNPDIHFPGPGVLIIALQSGSATEIIEVR